MNKHFHLLLHFFLSIEVLLFPHANIFRGYSPSRTCWKSVSAIVRSCRSDEKNGLYDFCFQESRMKLLLIRSVIRGGCPGPWKNSIARETPVRQLVLEIAGEENARMSGRNEGENEGGREKGKIPLAWRSGEYTHVSALVARACWSAR